MLEQRPCTRLAFGLGNQDIGVDKVRHRLCRAALRVLNALVIEIAEELISVHPGQGIIQRIQSGEGGFRIVIGKNVRRRLSLDHEERVELLTGVDDDRLPARLRCLQAATQLAVWQDFDGLLVGTNHLFLSSVVEHDSSTLAADCLLTLPQRTRTVPPL